MNKFNYLHYYCQCGHFYVIERLELPRWDERRQRYVRRRCSVCKRPLPNQQLRDELARQQDQYLPTLGGL